MICDARYEGYEASLQREEAIHGPEGGHQSMSSADLICRSNG